MNHHTRKKRKQELHIFRKTSLINTNIFIILNYHYLGNSNSLETLTNGSGRVKNPQNDLKNVQNGRPELPKRQKHQKYTTCRRKFAERTPCGALSEFCLPKVIRRAHRVRCATLHNLQSEFLQILGTHTPKIRSRPNYELWMILT